jgi:hypothetical protein
LRMMRGCGYELARFENVELPPAAKAYRAFLDESSWSAPWQRGAAVLTLFVEGSAHEREELAQREHPKPKTAEEIEAAVSRHPLVRVLGVAPSAMELVRVHQRIEGGHREDAWTAVLGQVTPEQETPVLQAMERALSLWSDYRDEVAQACGIAR